VGANLRRARDSWHSLGPDDDIPLSGGWTAKQIGIPEGDLFPALAAGTFERIALDPSLDSGRAHDLALKLRTKLNEAPEGPSVDSLAEQFLDLLDLPAWQKRHELYSVWISCLIAEALPEPKRWDLVDGTLSYAFGGAKLMTASIGASPVELWAERRSPIPAGGSGKRTRGVQPDYTLLLTPAGAPPLAALVVECKQYRIPSRRNFRDALQDYALAHSRAPVLLANYGPVPAGLADGLTNASGLIAGFGEVYPGGGGLTGFKEALGRSMDAAAAMEERQRRDSEARASSTATPAPVAPEPGDIGFDAFTGGSGDCVWLEWQSRADLDLHVRYCDGTTELEIYFRNLGRLSEYPYMQLAGDVTSGPGRETVRIDRWLAGKYRVVVERYRGEWPAQFTVGLRVGGKEQHFSVPAPEEDRVMALTIDGNAPEMPFRH